MVIEWQRIRVRPDRRDLYIKKDGEIWTAGLAREEGFLGKEVWRGEGSEVVLVIRWRSEDDWKGIAQERLDELDRRFRAVVPKDDWEKVEERSYEVV
jgi:uncharacterized protein (TIGR03792 family)